MKQRIFVAFLWLVFLALPAAAEHCPMCGGPMQGYGWNETIPTKLPRPGHLWLGKLTEALSLEERSRAQYRVDEATYGPMPYQRILPQEEDHIRWIRGLFRAYGIKASPKAARITPTKSRREAYEFGRGIEDDLIQRYRWLIRQAGDPTSREALETIQLQSRMHRMMFEHFLDMSE